MESVYMSDWDPNMYLEFDRERTQPSIDLAMRIKMDQPGRIIDIGCGPGNSTNVLKARWPRSVIIGLDKSSVMIAEAALKYPAVEWICADASDGLPRLGTFDIVFSNAAIQWMPNHKLLLHNLFNSLNPGGVLAIQAPDTGRMPVYTELVKLAQSDRWAACFADLSGAPSVNDAAYYYNIICNISDEIALWETRYFHVMDSHADIVKWYSGAGLKPYLDCLGDGPLQAEFMTDFKNALKTVYPIQPDGKILFPFTRIFFIINKGLNSK